MPHKGHHRTGSSAPALSMGSTTQHRKTDLQRIPEEIPMCHNGMEAGSPHTVRFPDHGDSAAGQVSLLTTMLDSPTSSQICSPRPDDSVVLPTALEDAVVVNAVSENVSATQAVPKLSLPANSDQRVTGIGRPELPPAMVADMVEFPHTPERLMQPAHVKNLKPSPSSYFSPVARASPQKLVTCTRLHDSQR